MMRVVYRCDRLMRLYCLLQVRRRGKWYRVAFETVKVLLREGLAHEVD